MSPTQRKNIIYSLVLAAAFLAIWGYRQLSQPSAAREVSNLKKIALQGTTMGTTYSVKYMDARGRNFKPSVDSLLEAFNMSMSTYIPESEISRFNQDALLKYESPFFYPVLSKSREIHQKTGGAFDPTVGPLVNAWGFGPEGRQTPPDAVVDSLLRLVNYDSVFFDSISICKMQKGMKLDFSAIAKGYGVDVVADFIADKGIENLFVEIGGEVMARGVNERGEPWRVGVNYPTENPDEQGRAQAIVSLHNQAIATSGNYRNYYEKDGIKYSHTISPVTGRPVRHSLLSASVFAPDCMTADAYATAFMVMGLDKAKELLAREKGLLAYFIYSDENGELQTWASARIEDQIKILATP
ncbi:ApbE family lipoprotein [Flammeovirgaceae bacterium 311]|nr:ApbE family lipoprotein [Flammeovirgaceae bacterium 311]